MVYFACFVVSSESISDPALALNTQTHTNYTQ